MGAKTWMLVYAEGNVGEVLKTNPRLDRDASAALASKLFPSENLQPLQDGNLAFTCPPDDEIRIGCFPGVSIVAAEECAIEPSQLAPKFLKEGLGKTIYVHFMHSVVDALAFGVWSDGKLVRSLSLSPEGISEDIGPRLAFEEPYWAGARPLMMDDDDSEYPLPFHPLDMGEAALQEFFGYQLEGTEYEERDPLFDPETIPLLSFKRLRNKPWWRFW